VSIVPGETDTADNTFMDGTVEIVTTLVAAIEAPDVANVHEDIIFDASGSAGNIVEYQWDFGDAYNETGWPIIITTTEPNITHNYPKVGIYGVWLKVVDDKGAVSYPAYHSIEIIYPCAASLVKWKAKPEAHHWVYSNDDDGLVKLTALARNSGSYPIDAKVTFAILTGAGVPGGPVIIEELTLAADGLDVPVIVYADPFDCGFTGSNKVVRYAQVTLDYYDPNIETWVTGSVKVVRFAIVP